MNDSKEKTTERDEELIGVLTAISVVSKNLARKLIRKKQSDENKEVKD